MPGLVNTHCHAADSLFRGLIEDLPLEPWLQTVWKAEGAILNRETVRLGATLGLAELLLGGVTTVMDMFWHPREGVAAARALGMRDLDRGHLLRRGRRRRPGAGDPPRRRRGVLRRVRRRRGRAARRLPARRLHRRAGEPAGRQAPGRGARRALLDPRRRDPRRAGDRDRALRPLGHPASRRARAARRAQRARALRLARRRGDRDPRPHRRHGRAQPGLEPQARLGLRPGARHAGGRGAGRPRHRRGDLGQRSRPLDGAAAGGDAAQGATP